MVAYAKTKSLLIFTLTLSTGLAWVKAQSKLNAQQSQGRPQNNVFNYSRFVSSSQLKNDAARVIEQFASALNSSTSHLQDNSKTVTLFKSVVSGGWSSALEHSKDNGIC